MGAGNCKRRVIRRRRQRKDPRTGENKEQEINSKKTKKVRCALLNGWAWSAEKKYMKRHKNTFDTFFGIDHRMRKEEMEEQFNREVKQTWRFAVDAARITDENASKDCKHTSGGVFEAVDSDLGAAVDKEEGAVL